MRQGVTQAVALRGGVTHRDMPTYKGDDGLSDAERIAYAVCNPVLPLLLLLLFVRKRAGVGRHRLQTGAPPAHIAPACGLGTDIVTRCPVCCGKRRKRAGAVQHTEGAVSSHHRSPVMHAQVSCKHAACLRNNLYMSEEFKKKKCGPLFEDWKKCFDAEVTTVLHARMHTLLHPPTPPAHPL